MALTARQVEVAKPKDKQYKLADAGGLYLAVLPSGGKSWRYNHKVNGKYQTKVYGTYPKLSLADARLLHAEFKDAGASKAAPTFKEVAKEWLKVKLPTLSNRKHQGQTASTLEQFVYPLVGDIPIDDIKRIDLVSVVKSVEARGTIETAHRVAGRIKMVFDFAQDSGLLESHPASGLVRVLRSNRKKKPMASIDPSEASKLMLAINGYHEPVTRLGLLLLAHTFVRVGELRGMQWDEIKRDDRVWVIPEVRMKLRKPHVVPLSKQVLMIIDELQQYSSGKYVIDSPARPGHPVSENTFLFALYRLGYRGVMTAHGFRALASTVLNEQSKFKPDAIERQLAHKEADEVRASYHRAEYLKDRRKLMQWYSDWLFAQYWKASQYHPLTSE